MDRDRDLPEASLVFCSRMVAAAAGSRLSIKSTASSSGTAWIILAVPSGDSVARRLDKRPATWFVRFGLGTWDSPEPASSCPALKVTASSQLTSAPWSDNRYGPRTCSPGYQGHFLTRPANHSPSGAGFWHQPDSGTRRQLDVPACCLQFWHTPQERAWRRT